MQYTPIPPAYIIAELTCYARACIHIFLNHQYHLSTKQLNHKITHKLTTLSRQFQNLIELS